MIYVYGVDKGMICLYKLRQVYMLAPLNMKEACSKQSKQKFDDVPNYKIGVVKVFSLNRINSLAERQAFAHCCELLQVWRKCFPCNLGKPKLYGKMFIFIILILIDICMGRCCANFRLIFAYFVDMPLCYGRWRTIEQMLSPYWHMYIKRLILLPLIVWQMLLPCFHL